MASRPHPFDLVFGPIADERFPPIVAALEADGRALTDRDAFVMTRDAVELLRDLRGDEPVGDAMDEMVAFAHHAFLHWSGGEHTITATAPDLAMMLDASHAGTGTVAGAPYVQLPERRVWGRILADGPHEPLDGFFVHQVGADTLRVLGVFGLHPQREGFSVAEVTGPVPPTLDRADGSASFAPRMAGGLEAGLLSVDDAGELLALGWSVSAMPVGQP